jgi:hypothetical protein
MLLICLAPQSGRISNFLPKASNWASVQEVVLDLSTRKYHAEKHFYPLIELHEQKPTPLVPEGKPFDGCRELRRSLAQSRFVLPRCIGAHGLNRAPVTALDNSGRYQDLQLLSDTVTRSEVREGTEVKY